MVRGQISKVRGEKSGRGPKVKCQGSKVRVRVRVRVKVTG